MLKKSLKLEQHHSPPNWPMPWIGHFPPLADASESPLLSLELWSQVFQQVGKCPSSAHSLHCPLSSPSAARLKQPAAIKPVNFTPTISSPLNHEACEPNQFSKWGVKWMCTRTNGMCPNWGNGGLLFFYLCPPLIPTKRGNKLGSRRCHKMAIKNNKNWEYQMVMEEEIMSRSLVLLKHCFPTVS